MFLRGNRTYNTNLGYYQYLSTKLSYRSGILLICIPLILSAYTHLWNTIGFPSVHVDEGHYMRRAMLVINGLGPQETDGSYTQQYDHPYFGQIFLGGVLSLVGYPDLYISSEGNSIQTAQSLYLVPRVLMGILAVVDTFLIYKITEQRYNRRVAFIAAVIFAVIPLGWMLRRIFLEPISLPLVLSSILFAVCCTRDGRYKSNAKNISLVLLSGIFLGLAIFTKIPLFAIIPLVGSLIYFNNKNLKLLGLWFIPVILIPLIWPTYAFYIGDFDKWWDGTLWQADRHNKPLFVSMSVFSKLDPLLFFLGMAGIAYTAVKRDFFPLLWIIPPLLFFAIQDFTRIYFWIPLFPAFCIGAAFMITDLSAKISKNKKKVKQLAFATVSAIAIFGLISTTMLITTNLNSSFFAVYGFIIQNLQNSFDNSINDYTDNKGVTLIGDHWIAGFAWIPKEVLDHKLDYRKFYFTHQPIKTEKILLIVSGTFNEYLEKGIFRGKQQETNEDKKILFDSAETIAKFQDNVINYDENRYPYTSMSDNRGIGNIEIRANY